MAGEAPPGAEPAGGSARSLMGRLTAKAGTVHVRTTVAATVIVGLALSLAAFALVAAMRNTLTDEVRSAARVRADDTAAALEAGTNPSFVTAGLCQTRLNDAFIQILDRDGAVVAASPLVAGDPGGRPPGPRGVRGGPRHR